MRKKLRLLIDGLIIPLFVYIAILAFANLIYRLFIKNIYEMNSLLIQTIASIFIIILYIIIYNSFKKRYEIKSSKIISRTFLYMIPIGISLCILFNIILIMVLKNIDNPVNEAVDELLKNYPIIVTIIAIAIFPPIIEELFFRGFLYEVMNRFFNNIVAIVVTSIFFAISHGNLVQGLYAFFAGLIIGFVRYKFNNILYPLTLHLIMNLSALFLGGAIISLNSIYEKIFTIFISLCIASISFYRIICVSEEK